MKRYFCLLGFLYCACAFSASEAPVANHLGYGDRTLNELIADINHALAAPLPGG